MQKEDIVMSYEGKTLGTVLGVQKEVSFIGMNGNETFKDISLKNYYVEGKKEGEEEVLLTTEYGRPYLAPNFEKQGTNYDSILGATNFYNNQSIVERMMVTESAETRKDCEFEISVHKNSIVVPAYGILEECGVATCKNGFCVPALFTLFIKLKDGGFAMCRHATVLLPRSAKDEAGDGGVKGRKPVYDGDPADFDLRCAVTISGKVRPLNEFVEIASSNLINLSLTLNLITRQDDNGNGGIRFFSESDGGSVCLTDWFNLTCIGMSHVFTDEIYAISSCMEKAFETCNSNKNQKSRLAPNAEKNLESWKELFTTQIASGYAFNRIDVKEKSTSERKDVSSKYSKYTELAKARKDASMKEAEKKKNSIKTSKMEMSTIAQLKALKEAKKAQNQN